MFSTKFILILVIAFFSTSINSIHFDDEPKVDAILNVESECITGNCYLTACINGQYACVTYGHEDYSCTSCNNECPDIVVTEDGSPEE